MITRISADLTAISKLIIDSANVID